MQKVILIMGPTASGKTDLAIEIASIKNTHIISVDSALVYKDMNIGTAKPDSNILKAFPHALVDIISPEAEYSVARFLNDAKKEIAIAFAQNKIPILVGGTPFYFNALQNGLSNLPESTAESRIYFDNLLRTKGNIFLHQELQKIDKIASDRIHTNDSQRLSRALEVYYLSGKTLTDLQNKKQGAITCPLKKIVIMPPRNIIHARIEKRFLQMLKLGFIDEVVSLKAKYNLSVNITSMRSIGYRQIWQYLEGQINKQKMVENVTIATRQLCKRQSTWFNNEKNAKFIENIGDYECLNLLLSNKN